MEVLDGLIPSAQIYLEWATNHGIARKRGCSKLNLDESDRVEKTFLSI